MEEPKYYDIRHVAGISTHIDIDNSVVESAGSSFFDTAVIRVLGQKGWGVLTVDNFGEKSRAETDGFIQEALKFAAVTEERVELADAPGGILPVPAMKE
ncbi:MAG: TldD/PmbA family protein, partial [Methanogenium sp.]|nr:TldD/PmbA family protein [Methanogenium sp.]